MAKINQKVHYPSVATHEGAPAIRLGAEKELRRAVMSCLLWEDGFYESGKTIADRISDLVSQVSPTAVSQIAIEARTQGNLRHVPLLLARNLARLKYDRLDDLIFQIIQRPDELTEFLAIYWKDKKQPLSAKVKKGLARAFTKFDEYSLAKYNRDEAIKLRDVLFLTHAKPLNEDQASLWKKLVDGSLPTPDTWEVAISACGNDSAAKKETWIRLLNEGKLGALALLRNLRNMQNLDISDSLIGEALSKCKVDRVLPFRFISAARYAPTLEPHLESLMMKCVSQFEKLRGKTTLLIDVSGSMNGRISSKSEISRIDAACGLAILAREICEEVEIITFSDTHVVVPPRRGFALRDAITTSQPHSGTYLGKATDFAKSRGYDRLLVFTDEESHDPVHDPISGSKAYMINVATTRYAVGWGLWTRIEGFSESVMKFIAEFEKGE